MAVVLHVAIEVMIRHMDDLTMDSLVSTNK